MSPKSFKIFILAASVVSAVAFVTAYFSFEKDGPSKQAQASSSSTTVRLPKPGGIWTRDRQPMGSLMSPAQHLNPEEQLRFFSGFSFFRTPWISAPASTTARDGLGPLFNAHSCEACHINGGRGPSLMDAPARVGTVIATSEIINGVGVPHSITGVQLDTRATYTNGREGIATISYTELAPQQIGKRAVALRQPSIQVDWNIQLEKKPTLTARVAPPLIGMGLLEYITVSRLESLEDAKDLNQDGISGRINWIESKQSASKMAGRFGWKANHATLESQVGTALRNDLGITNHLFPEQPCTATQNTCLNQAHGNGPVGEHEISEELFEYLVYFTRYIPPPAAAEATEKVIKGQEHFEAVGCAACHTPSHQTPAGTIWPYTDMLLHDMGEALAEPMSQGDAAGSEWRTPPLWGVGTMKKVSGHTSLLHDGRARDVLEAILWHAGEANGSRQKFVDLSTQQKRELLAFIKAL